MPPRWIEREELLPLLQQVSEPDSKNRLHAVCPFCGGSPEHFILFEKGFSCVKCGEKGRLKALAEHLNYERPPEPGKAPKPKKVRIVATYDYLDPGSHEFSFQAVRWLLSDGDKTFSQRVRAPEGWQPCGGPKCVKEPYRGAGIPDAEGWIWSIDGCCESPSCLPRAVRSLYRCDWLRRAALRGEDTVWIASGEKATEYLWDFGLVATTNPLGEGKGKWLQQYSEALRPFKHAIIAEDNDPAGPVHTAEVALSLWGVVPDIRVVRFQDMPKHSGADDFLDAGGTVDQMIERAEVWQPPPEPQKTPEKPERRVLPWSALINGGSVDVDWLVRDLLPVGSLGILSGESGHGKTWILLHLAQCVASGASLFGQFPCRQGKVLVWDEESSEALLRQRAQLLAAGTPEVSHDLPVEFVRGWGLRLDSDSGVAEMREVIAKEKPELVIVDALVDVHSADENSATEMQQVFATVQALQREHPACWLIAHHLRKLSQISNEPRQRLRGSSGIAAVLDVHLHVRQVEKGQLLLQLEKMRAAEPAPDFTIRLDSDHESVSLSYEGLAQATMSKIELATDLLYEALADADDKSMARADLLRQCGGQGVEARNLALALSEMVKAGRVCKVGFKGRKMIYRLVPPEGTEQANEMPSLFDGQ